MKKQPSHSELRDRILIALSQGPATSIADLARSLNALRPSVSRSIKSLENANLVARKDRILSLTETGRVAVRELEATLTNKARKTSGLYTRILESANNQREKMEVLLTSPQVRAIEDFANSPTAQAMEAFINSPTARAIEDFANSPAARISLSLQNHPALQLDAALRNHPALQLGATLDVAFRNYQPLQAAISAAAHVQAMNLNWLQAWPNASASSWSHLLLENNALLSGMMMDLEAIAKAATMPSFAFGDLVDQTIRSTTTYEAYINDIALSISQPPRTEVFNLAVITPTETISSMVNSTRGMIESQTTSSEEETPPHATGRVIVYTELYMNLTIQLIDGLKPLGDRFINKWEGAWQTLYSDSKDRHSQVTHSGRELLMQVLAHLAPDSVFSKEEIAKYGVNNKVTRKMRIRRILGSSSESPANLIDSFADTLDNMYHVLVGEAHRRDDQIKTDLTVASLLATLGNMLVMLLNWRRLDLP
jgi:DNA-binding MarR family transcriptional regulator